MYYMLIFGECKALMVCKCWDVIKTSVIPVRQVWASNQRATKFCELPVLLFTSFLQLAAWFLGNALLLRFGWCNLRMRERCKKKWKLKLNRQTPPTPHNCFLNDMEMYLREYNVCTKSQRPEWLENAPKAVRKKQTSKQTNDTAVASVLQWIFFTAWSRGKPTFQYKASFTVICLQSANLHQISISRAGLLSTNKHGLYFFF